MMKQLLFLLLTVFFLAAQDVLDRIRLDDYLTADEVGWKEMCEKPLNP